MRDCDGLWRHSATQPGQMQEADLAVLKDCQTLFTSGLNKDICSAYVQPDHQDRLQKTDAYSRGGLGCVVPALRATITRTKPRGARGAFLEEATASPQTQETFEWLPIPDFHPIAG